MKSKASDELALCYKTLSTVNDINRFLKIPTFSARYVGQSRRLPDGIKGHNEMSQFSYIAVMI